MDETTDGTLLERRLRYRQFRHGYRTGIEPVLLAAAIPARPGQRVLEAGCGAGAAIMCLCARVPGLQGVGIEVDPATAALARHNWSSNGMDQLTLREASLPALPDGIGRFHHVFANPPWHRPRSSVSPLPRRDLARRAEPGQLEAWIVALARLLEPGGSLTLILPAALHARASGAMHARAGEAQVEEPRAREPRAELGGIVLLPFWPKPGLPAKLVLLQGTKASRSDGAILPGLILHHDGGRYTEAAERILRGGEALTPLVVPLG